MIGDKLCGIAVRIGARVAGLAGGARFSSPAPSGTWSPAPACFREGGAHELKGVPGPWQLYSVEPD